MLHTLHLRMLAALIFTVVLLTSGVIWQGYAGIEPPEGTKVIRRPYLEGIFVALFDPVQDKAAFTFTGKCRGTNLPTELGPLVLDSFPASFFDPTELAGAFIASDLLGAPSECFAKSGVIVGYVVSKVRRFTVLRPNVVIAQVEMSAVGPQ